MIAMLVAILAGCGGAILLWQRRRLGSIALDTAGAKAPLDMSPVTLPQPANFATLDQSSRPTIFLRIVGTPYAYQAPIAAQTVTVGRQRRRPGLSDEGNDLVIRVPDSTDQTLRISRRHMEIQRIGNKYFVVDHSRGGTQLDGKALVKGQPTPLDSGNQLVLAGVITLEFLVQVDSLAINAQAFVNLPPSPLRRMPIVMEASVGDMITVEPLPLAGDDD
jgi:hypothetical protein